jgi:hypothetical protein
VASLSTDGILGAVIAAMEIARARAPVRRCARRYPRARAVARSRGTGGASAASYRGTGSVVVAFSMLSRRRSARGGRHRRPANRRPAPAGGARHLIGGRPRPAPRWASRERAGPFRRVYLRGRPRFRSIVQAWVSQRAQRGPRRPGGRQAGQKRACVAALVDASAAANARESSTRMSMRSLREAWLSNMCKIATPWPNSIHRTVPRTCPRTVP